MLRFKFICLILLSTLYLSCGDKKSPEDSKFLIAYNVAVDENADDYDIWTVDPLTSERKNITENPDVAWTYLAVNDKILFISDRDTAKRNYLLYEMNSDGTGLSRISNIRLADSWMSSRQEGTELIVKPHNTVDSSFYIIDRKGLVLNKISTSLPFMSDPCFSPDGTKIVFRGGQTRSKLIDGFNEELYLMDSDGKNMQQLSQYPHEDSTASKFDYRAGPPRWHPAENFISYQSFQNGKYSLYGISPDGAKQWKLNDYAENEGWHAWSPDGKQLAIEVFDSSESQFHILWMDWKSKETKLFTDTSYRFQQAPVFVTISR